MPLPIVYPKRKKWYEKTAGARWEIDEKTLKKNTEDFLQIKRWKFFKEFEFTEGFLDYFKNDLMAIQRWASYNCTRKLKELVEKRRYVMYTREGNSTGTFYYDRDGRFPTVFNVFVFIKDNRLVYKIHYFYQDLKIRRWNRREESLPRYLSLYGIDKRDDLPDILNTPVTLYHNSDDLRFKYRTRRFKRKVGKREGRYFEVFDNWFRTEMYNYFLKKCEEKGFL